jgi:Fur family transcriptional regulator, peroxide stress response regulator
LLIRSLELDLDKNNEHKKIELFIKQCKDAGLNVTPQRLAIYRSLLGDHSHPSPDAVYRRVRKLHPTISVATIHKTLDTFEKHGIISRLTPLHESVRYDPMAEPHHHIICIRCKKVVNLAEDEISPVRIPDHVRRDNTILGYSVHVNVLCSDCRRK